MATENVKSKRLSPKKEKQPINFSPSVVLKDAEGIYSQEYDVEKIHRKLASMLMGYIPEVRSQAIDVICQRFDLRSSKLAGEVRRLELNADGRVSTPDHSPESEFNSLKETYHLEDPELIKGRIMWRYMMQLAVQLMPGCRTDIKYHNQHWRLCDHVIEYRNSLRNDKLKAMQSNIALPTHPIFDRIGKVNTKIKKIIKLLEADKLVAAQSNILNEIEDNTSTEFLEFMGVLVDNIKRKGLPWDGYKDERRDADQAHKLSGVTIHDRKLSRMELYERFIAIHPDFKNHLTIRHFDSWLIRFSKFWQQINTANSSTQAPTK